MKTRHSFILAGVFVMLETHPVFANQPPGPLVALPEIFILPIMIILTAVGGGYAIIKQRNGNKHGLLKIISAAFVLFFSAINEGLAVIVCVFFGFIALQRAFFLISWGVATGSENAKPEYLMQASSWRLISSGSMLILITLFLVGMALAFVAYWPVPPKKIEEGLEQFLAYEIARAHIEKQKTGEMRFKAVKEGAAGHTVQYWKHGRSRNIQIQYGKDDKSFVVHVPPGATTGVFGRFPFFPYNYLISLPSYRADETGQIRMIYAHDKYEQCPADAPVVRTVSEDEIQKAMAEIQGGQLKVSQ